MSITDKQRAGLTNTVRQYIEILERDLADAKKELDEARTVTDGPSPITYTVHFEKDYALPDTSQVTFNLPDANPYGFNVRVQVSRNGWLEINADGALVTKHQASNTLFIASDSNISSR
jgi:hypothetical protein